MNKSGNVLLEESAPVYGVWFGWAEGAEWLCDKDGVVFTFEFKDEAEALRVLLEVDGVVSEVRPYAGDQASRGYPWPEEALTVSVNHV